MKVRVGWGKKVEQFGIAYQVQNVDGEEVLQSDTSFSY